MLRRKGIRPIAWHFAIVMGCLGCSSCREPFADIPTLRLSEPKLDRAAPKLVQVAQVSPVKKPAAKPAKPDPSREFFERGPIPQLKIQVSPENAQKLRGDPRKYVPCVLLEDGKTTYKQVSLKIKGAAGSFRPFDDRPALTLNMKKELEQGDELFHGLDKFHLNNSVQDESLLSELLCAQLCQEAGCPTARVTHARVWLNDRDLGMYVLKEGYDETFLARHFSSPEGNLYDGGFLREIDQDLEKDEGEGPEDRSDLKALVAACREGDPAKRQELLAQRLDVDAFLNFTALELMMCHWDGYVQARNNYRIYFRPDDKRAVFLPHGMDQMFADPNFPVLHHPGALVAHAVLGNLENKAKYRERVKALLPMFAPAKLNAKLDSAHDRLRPAIAAISEDRARQFDDRTRDMKNRVAARAQNIRNQLRSGPPEPLVFNKEGWAKVEEWNPMPEGDARLEEQEVEGKTCYAVHVGPSNRTTASWRRKVLLAKGSYRLEAQGKVSSVKPVEDEKGKGLGLRLGGGKRENQLAGTTPWQPLSHAFEIPEESREVELVAELRSTSGSGFFDAGSLKIVKVK